MHELSKADLDRVRGLANRVGTESAAEMIGISRTALLGLLAGTGTNNGTIALVLAALHSGVTDKPPPTDDATRRADPKPSTKRRA